jgi:hypothetical protein
LTGWGNALVCFLTAPSSTQQTPHDLPAFHALDLLCSELWSNSFQGRTSKVWSLALAASRPMHVTYKSLQTLHVCYPLITSTESGSYTIQNLLKATCILNTYRKTLRLYALHYRHFQYMPLRKPRRNISPFNPAQWPCNCEPFLFLETCELRDLRSWGFRR